MPILHERHTAGVWVVTLQGSIAITDGSRIRAAIDLCLAHRPAAVVVDLREITTVDGVVMTALPSWQRRAELAYVPLEYVVTDDLAQWIRRAPAQYFIRAHRSVQTASAWALHRPRRPAAEYTWSARTRISPAPP